MKSLRHTKAKWPITLEELINRRDQYTKVESRWSIWFLIIFFSFLLANLPFSNWLESDEAPKWLSVVWVTVFFVILIGNIPLLCKATKKRLRSFDLTCPSCTKDLRAQALPMAIATGHCCNCGIQLVSNHPANTPPFTTHIK